MSVTAQQAVGQAGRDTDGNLFGTPLEEGPALPLFNGHTVRDRAQTVGRRQGAEHLDGLRGVAPLDSDHTGRDAERDGRRGLEGMALPQQRFIEVSGPITIESEGFRFVEDYRGMEVIPEAGSVIAYDGGREVTTPYDNCVLIMPSRRLSPGASAVRLGRFVEVD